MTLDLLLEKEERGIRSTLELLNDGERLSGEDWRPVLVNENERQLRYLAALRKAIEQREYYASELYAYGHELLKENDNAELTKILSGESE